MSPDAPTPDPGRVVDARPGTARPEADAPVDDQTADEPTADEPTEAADPADPGDPGDPVGPTDVPADEEVAEEVAAEVVEGDLAALLAERDQYLDQLRRLQADFENYRKRVQKQQEELAERATEALVRELLPVLDACEAATAHGDASVEPVAKALVDALAKQGLDKVEPTGEAFDPNHHEAVTHEPGDGNQVVTEVLRPGYVWQGRVLRPAMVRVRG